MTKSSSRSPRPLALPLLAFLAAALFLAAGCAKSRGPETIHVALTRNDGVEVGVFQGFIFDPTEITETLEQHPTTFPEPRPEDAQVCYFHPGRVFGLLRKAPDQSSVSLILDVNANRDLTDDAPIEIPKVEDPGEGAVVKIARYFTAPEAHTEWLPYRISYQERTMPDGTVRESLSVAPHYDYRGEFNLGDGVYAVAVHDGDMGGRFIREKQVNVQLRVGPKEDMETRGAVPYRRLFELYPIGDTLCELSAIAEDGAWVEFTASGLPVTGLGRPAPDLELTDAEGKIFRISDYRGRVLVLDFWYVWCKPCIAKFPAIKAMFERYADKPLAAVGINIDIPERVEQARQIIAEHGLTWRQVLEGKGEFLPVYQIFGRLPERPMSFPIYVAIDEAGITRYATNDFEKMGRFLEYHFNDPAGPDGTLFIPMRIDYSMDGTRRIFTAVDFESPQAAALRDGGTLKLPEGMPSGARIGRLPNGIAAIAYPGEAEGTVRLILDADGDSDLTKETAYEIPVLETAEPEDAAMVETDCRINYKSGAVGFAGFPFFARPTGEIVFKGTVTNFSGEFSHGRTEYRLEFTDPNGDRLITVEDLEAPSLMMRLLLKLGGAWERLHEGTIGLKIGRDLWRVRAIYDDGQLVELERD